jgi:hypothetical protein
MNTTRTGKIARLPGRIRDQLNRRLHDGEQAKHLAAWLNTLPEVQAIMATVFAGKPIRPQNLSEWRQGGYRDWLLQQEALPLARQLTQDAAPLHSHLSVADFLAHTIAARYALAACALSAQDGPEQWRRLRELCADAVQLRRGDQAAERLRLDRDRFARHHQQAEEEVAECFHRWTRNPKVRDWICCDSLSPEERERRLREIFGLSPDDTANPAAQSHAPTNGDSPQSN